MRDASKNVVYAKKKQKTENRKREEKQKPRRKEPIQEDTHSTRCRPPHGEVYLAPEDDNRLQINCNYVDIVHETQTWRR